MRAELSSAFVGSTLGIPTDIPQHVSYVANWLKALKQDKREIFPAAADAQRIADMALAFHPAYVATLKPEPESTGLKDVLPRPGTKAALPASPAR